MRIAVSRLVGQLAQAHSHSAAHGGHNADHDQERDDRDPDHNKSALCHAGTSYYRKTAAPPRNTRSAVRCKRMSSEPPQQPQRPRIPQDMKAFNEALIAEVRANGGKAVSGPMAGSEPMLLTTTGAKSFAERTVVIGFRKYGDAYAVIASNNGADKAPYWFANLQANPVATVELGAEKFKVKARVAEGAERAEVAKLIDYYERQQALTSREIPIVILERV